MVVKCVNHPLCNVAEKIEKSHFAFSFLFLPA